MSKAKFTKRDFDRFYPTDDTCLHEVFMLKHRDTAQCPKCNKKFNYYKLKGLKLYSCAYCGNNIAPTANTIFHKSSTSLKDWFYAIYLFSISKNGVSGKELERQLGVTYKCAWRIANRIRKLFDENVNPLDNIVEIDETYCGGKEANKHKNKRTAHAQGRSLKVKTPVLGAVERKGNVIAKVVTNTESNTIKPFVKENIKITAEVKTDEYHPYKTLKGLGYNHDTVNHGKREYAKGNTHTNNLEGFWSQLKRSVHGTYHSVSPKYLQNYVDEFAYRYNRRESETPIFLGLVEKAALPLQEDSRRS